MKALFPDNCYRFESGGYPDAIPQLTQEKFEQFHKTYYSPENSYIYYTVIWISTLLWNISTANI